jgi:hypothetical protein
MRQRYIKIVYSIEVTTCHSDNSTGGVTEVMVFGVLVFGGEGSSSKIWHTESMTWVHILESSSNRVMCSVD